MNISEVLASLAGCLCSELATGPELCFCGVIPGQSVVADYMGDCENNGMAWVRLGQSYPASGVGVVNQVIGNCNAGLGFDVEVGVLREHILQPEPFTETDLLAITQQQTDDMLAARRAIQCCPAFSSKDYILGNYMPQGPFGGLVGGAWTVYVMVD